MLAPSKQPVYYMVFSPPRPPPRNPTDMTYTLVTPQQDTQPCTGQDTPARVRYREARRVKPKHTSLHHIDCCCTNKQHTSRALRSGSLQLQGLAVPPIWRQKTSATAVQLRPQHQQQPQAFVQADTLPCAGTTTARRCSCICCCAGVVMLGAFTTPPLLLPVSTACCCTTAGSTLQGLSSPSLLLHALGSILFARLSSTGPGRVCVMPQPTAEAPRSTAAVVASSSASTPQPVSEIRRPVMGLDGVKAGRVMTIGRECRRRQAQFVS